MTDNFQNNLVDTMMETGGIINTLITFASIVFVLFAIYYIFTSAMNAKALRMMGYKMAWIAWIPYLRYYAIADATREDGSETKIYNTMGVPNTLYTLWWVILLLLSAFDDGLAFWLPTTLVSVIDFVLRGIFLGGAYGRMFAVLEHKDIKDTNVIGVWSGVLPIIAAFKFLKYKPDKEEATTDAIPLEENAPATDKADAVEEAESYQK